MIIYHVVFLHTDPGDVWISNDTFEINGRIENTLKKTVFGIVEDDKVAEMPFDEKDKNQKWKKVMKLRKTLDKEEYFTLCHTSSGKALTAISDNQLAIKGKMLIVKIL